MLPSLEVANNRVDDDCDGVVDEGSECAPGLLRPCFLGRIGDDALALAQGVCRAGQQRCLDSGQWSEQCENERRPQRSADGLFFEEQSDQCDGLDNDCDGLRDENPDFDRDGDGFTVCGNVFYSLRPPRWIGALVVSGCHRLRRRADGGASRPDRTLRHAL